MDSKGTILVTGGLGFIGSHFLKLLAAREHEGLVVNLDKMTYAAGVDNLVGLDLPGYRFYHADISAPNMWSFFEAHKPRYVVNFAAESHVDRSIDDPSVFATSNFMGVRNLLEACRKSGCVERFLQVSTDEVYGDIPLSSDPSVETDPLRPSSPYSATKAAADLLALSYVRTYGLNVVITRCSNNYGPNQHPEKFVPRMVTNLLLGQKVPVYGKGENIRDWIHVEDHCLGILMALERGVSGQVYNFGGSCELRNLTVVENVLEIMGLGEKFDELVEFVGDRPGHDLRYAIDWSKSRSAFGWYPRWKFYEGLNDTVQWYRENEAWWRARIKP